jgi:hypothetical protein
MNDVNTRKHSLIQQPRTATLHNDCGVHPVLPHSEVEVGWEEDLWMNGMSALARQTSDERGLFYVHDNEDDCMWTGSASLWLR